HMAAQTKRVAGVSSPVAPGRRARGRAQSEASFSRPALKPELPAGYARLVGDIKDRIHKARLSAAAAVNRELLVLYYSIGFDLDRRLQGGGVGKRNHRSSLAGSPVRVS